MAFSIAGNKPERISEASAEGGVAPVRQARHLAPGRRRCEWPGRHGGGEVATVVARRGSIRSLADTGYTTRHHITHSPFPCGSARAWTGHGHKHTRRFSLHRRYTTTRARSVTDVALSSR